MNKKLRNYVPSVKEPKAVLSCILEELYRTAVNKLIIWPVIVSTSHVSIMGHFKFLYKKGSTSCMNQLFWCPSSKNKLTERYCVTYLASPPTIKRLVKKERRKGWRLETDTQTDNHCQSAQHHTDTQRCTDILSTSILHLSLHSEHWNAQCSNCLR